MQKDRKKVHKKVIKYIQMRNKQLAEDEYVGLNRFRIDIWSENMHRFSDGSGVRLIYILKLTDSLTGNSAYFETDNFWYEYKIFEYANDFLIRCSSGWSGHWPHLHYLAYDVHEVIDYKGRIDKGFVNEDEYEDEIINTYSWIDSIKF